MKMSSDPKNYRLNNIVFRIASSDALRVFKEVQNFVLTEIEFGSYSFSRVAKEIALLYSDSAFRILYSIEMMFIREGSPVLTREMADSINKILLDQIGYMRAVVEENGDVFDRKFVEIWKEVHLPIVSIIENIVEMNIGEKIEDTFKDICSIFGDSLDTVRFELYELDYLINDGRKPFLVISDMCVVSFDTVGVLLPTRRAQVYIEKLDLEPEFYVKNYTSTYAGYRRCINNLVENGIKILNGQDRKDVSEVA